MVFSAPELEDGFITPDEGARGDVESGSESDVEIVGEEAMPPLAVRIDERRGQLQALDDMLASATSPSPALRSSRVELAAEVTCLEEERVRSLPWTTALHRTANEGSKQERKLARERSKLAALESELKDIEAEAAALLAKRAEEDRDLARRRDDCRRRGELQSGVVATEQARLAELSRSTPGGRHQ